MENNFTKEQLMKIPRNFLVWVYAIVPVLVLITLVDIYHYHGYLQQFMGAETLWLPIFVLVLGFPHIVGSFFSFFDDEYVSHYKKHLFIYLPLFLVAVGALLWYDYIWGLVFFLIADVWHGVRQKVGIGLIMGTRPGWINRIWTWLPFVASSLVFVYFLTDVQLIENLNLAVLLLVGSYVISSLVMWVKSAKKVRWYIFAVTMLFLTNYYFVLAGYLVFAVLAFRFVHDVSAFAFYITHDHNRKNAGKKNWLYQLFSFIPLPVLVLTPALAFLVAALTQMATKEVYFVVILISMCHYYLESVMWKRDAPHRQHVVVSD